MNESRSNGRLDRESGEISLLDLATVIVRRWKALSATIACMLVLAAVVVFALPQRYLARTVIVPSAEGGSGRGLMMLSDQLPIGISDLVGGGNRSDRMMIEAVLNSRTLGDSLVSRMGFVPYAGTRGEAEIREVLRKRVRVSSSPDRSFAIEVRDDDPERAATIANYIPELTNQLLSSLVSDAAVRKQEFLEGQVQLAQAQLEQSERQLVAFQTTQDAPELQEQARRTIEAAALLQQQIIEQEIRVSQLRRTATADNPELRSAMAELSAWRGQLSRMTTGQGRDNQVFLSLRESPELRASATRLLREYAKNEKIFISLTAALTEAQLEVRNNLPVVSVLDAAIVPQSPTRTRPAIVFTLALVLGAVVGLAGIFVSEYFRGAKSDPENEHFFVAWSDLKRDVSRIVPGQPQAEKSARGS